MRQILENRTGSPTLPGAVPRSSSRLSTTSIIVTVACICTAAYLALVLLPSLSPTWIGEKDFEEAVGKKPHQTSPSVVSRPSPPPVPFPRHNEEQPVTEHKAAKKDDEDKNTDHEAVAVEHHQQHQVATAGFTCSKPLNSEPWGYNKNRNIPRWKYIFCEIARDQQAVTAKDTSGGEGAKPFTVVDYGADQGFFSISIARHFPQATVMGVELGGFGGEIWAKDKKSKDVLKIQEDKLAEFNVKNMLICQTKVSEKMFFELQDQHMVSRYQLVLSVFHWFDLPTKESFQKTVTTLFRNAQTTFIELPTIGDRSALIRKQVGWDNWKHWYEGHDNVKEGLESAAASEGLKVSVKLVAALPWVKWTRDVYRVDLLADDGVTAIQGAELPEWNCPKRRGIYGCNKTRKLHQQCPATPSS